MISFAGVGLTPPSDADEIIGRFWHKNAIQQFDDPFYTATGGLDHLPMPAAPARTPPRIGVLTWPTTASRWAVCNLLATGDQLTAIGATTQRGDLVLADGFHTPLTFPMWMLPARPISQRGAKELYLITLVDERYFWWQSGSSGSDGALTWSGLLGLLLAGVGASALLPSVPSAYGKPNKLRWSTGFKPLPPIIDAAAQTVGFRLVRYPDGTSVFQNYTTATADANAQWEAFKYEAMSGGLISTMEIARSVPGSVGIEFSGEDWGDVVVRNLGNAAIDEFAGLSGTSGVGHIFGDLYRPGICVPLGVTQAYETAKLIYADQATKDYFGWHLAKTDATFRGLVGRRPTGFDLCIEWVHPPSGEMVTRVIRRPFSEMNIYGDRGKKAYEIVQEEGLDLPQRPRLNFIGIGKDGLGITAMDNPGCNRTDVKLSPAGAGCGLKFDTDTNTYSVDVDSLAGSGLGVEGSGSECKKLKVNYPPPPGTLGCGLENVGGKTRVNLKDLVQGGLEWDEDNCILSQNIGCGLFFDGTSIVVNHDNLAGTASITSLVTVGSCGIKVDLVTAATTDEVLVTNVTQTLVNGQLCISKTTQTYRNFFNAAGLHISRLAYGPPVTSTSGCIDFCLAVACCTATTLSVACTASSTTAIVCPATAISFTGTGSGGVTTCGAYSYFWTFGDGIGSSILQNPNYTYTTAGTFTATVTVTDCCGKTATCSPPAITVTDPCTIGARTPIVPGNSCAAMPNILAETDYQFHAVVGTDYWFHFQMPVGHVNWWLSMTVACSSGFHRDLFFANTNFPGTCAAPGLSDLGNTSACVSLANSFGPQDMWVKVSVLVNDGCVRFKMSETTC